MLTIPILPNPYEGIPEIDRSRIPAEQMPAFLHIVQLLADLGLYERQLLLAVYLYEYSQTAGWELRNDSAKMEWSLWTIGGWQSLAARDGALTIYHFGKATEGLQSSFRFCPALDNQIEHKKIRQARKNFDASFPDSIAIRDAIAHVADFSQTAEKKKSHSVKGPFSKKWFSSDDPQGVTWLSGNMNGHTYAITLRGKLYTYDLNLASAAKLREVKLQIFSAFESATIRQPAGDPA